LAAPLKVLNMFATLATFQLPMFALKTELLNVEALHHTRGIRPGMGVEERAGSE
jgi:hypothetical protein